MSRYQHKENRRKRSRRERIGFYTAVAICLIAVCMAVYSTYNSVINPSGAKLTPGPTQSVEVNQPVTGVKTTFPVPTLGDMFETTEPDAEEDVLPTAVAEDVTQPSTETATYSDDALQTMLSADLSLIHPTRNGTVLREYSKDSVYYKMLNVWKPHMGCDFAADLGDDVIAMTGGEVTKVSDDKLFGKTVEISVNNAVCIYSGVSDIKVKQGDRVSQGDVIASVGVVPLESADANHIHVAVKVNDNYADPLNFIGNNA